MKIRHILLGTLIGLVVIAGCGSEETAVMNPGETEMNQESQSTTDTVTETDTVSESESDTGEAVEASTEIEEEENKLTVKNFLKTALLPVGNTMYIWGGGWNEEDTGAGPGAVTIGVRPEWAGFADLQNENYDYKEHRYEIMSGLDCSGYVGWAVYNLFEEESGNEGYVFKSTETAAKYSEFGWGELLESPEEFLAGDIVSMKGHVWISLGMCEDGSVVLMHASPPGVSICGTVLVNGEKSQAVELAEKYMSDYYPEWQAKYPDREVGQKYVTEVTVMRWNAETLADVEELQGMTAEEVLKVLFEE